MHWKSRRPAAFGRVKLAMIAVVVAGTAAAAQTGSPGITSPTVFEPFVPGAPRCSKPPNLQPVLAFAKDNEREFIQGVDHGLAQAAKDRGLKYKVALAANDGPKMLADVDAMRAGQVGAIVVSPVDPAALAPALQMAIWSGIYVSTVVAPPATSLLNAPQYLTGQQLGDAAVAYIQAKFNGRADVVLLTQDSLQFLTPRFVAIRDALDKLPEVRVVADISPSPVSKEGGLATMRTVLLAHPNVDVVLGADGVVLGALQALREAGKARPDQFLGGIDGEPEAIAEIQRGDGPYKATVSLNSPVFGYAMGQHAADWLEGKQIPQAMDILPRMITAENLSDYQKDLANPGAVYANQARRDSYLRMYGNICYDSRSQYVNFPWSSEAK